MLFDPNYKYLDDEEQRLQKRRLMAIADATGVVWRQIMVPEFNNALEAGQITLYARRTADGAFQPVPLDVWPNYQITDWETGHAEGPGSSLLLSIHAAPTPAVKRGRAPTYDYDKIRGEVFRLLKRKGEPDLANDEGWRTLADLKRALEPFCEKVFGSIPARSTLDSYVNRALTQWRARALANARTTE